MLALVWVEAFAAAEVRRAQGMRDVTIPTCNFNLSSELKEGVPHPLNKEERWAYMAV